MGAKNQVIAGEYLHQYVGSDLSIGIGNVKITKYRVAHYEVVDAESRKSASSAVGRAAVGAALLGPLGLVAGVTAKRKGIYTVSIEFTDGKKSLIEIDEKRYKRLITELY